MRSTIPLVSCLGLLPLQASPTLEHLSSLDAGGGRSAAGAILHDGMFGGIVGISGDTTVVRHGFVAQIYDPVKLRLGASPDQVNEGEDRQLLASRVMDDDTTLALDPAKVTWSENSDAISNIDSNGLATATLVYQDTLAQITGSYAGLDDPDGFDLNVINTASDDFGIYAADGIDDDWQVTFFGIENPLAAPGEDPDKDRNDNRMEFLTGFDPTDASEFFRLSVEGFSGPGTMDLKLNKVVPGRIYRLLESPDLVTPFSEVMTFSVTAESHDQIVQDEAAPAGRNFYQIEISKP